MTHRIWHIFISYARKDLGSCEKLEQHLSDLRLSGRINVWIDQRVEAGETWEPEILAHLDEADVVLLLVSPAFLASRYCQEIEIPRLMERWETGSVQVIPILLEPADFQGRPFSKFQAVPTTGAEGLKAISLWENQDEAYVEVVTRLRRTLNALEGRSAPEAPQPFDRQRYLDAFIRRLDALDQGVEFDPDTFVEPGKDVAGPKVDLTLGLPEQKVDNTTVSLATLIDTHRAQRVLALLGDPGSGKSVLLRQLGRELALRAYSSEVAPLPLYLSLGAYNRSLPRGGPQPLAYFIREQLAMSPQAAESALAPLTERMLADGELVLLLDGMDEMRRADFSERVDAIRTFTQQRARPRVIVACRRQDFPQKQFNAQQIRLEPFNKERVHTYLARILGEERALGLTEQVLSPSSGLVELVNTPLYLALLARFVKRRGLLPRTRAELLEDFVTPQLERALQSRPGLERTRIEAELAELSLVLLRHGGAGTGMASAELLEALGGQPRQRLVVLEVGLAAGLLRRDELRGEISFIHLRFLEYFAALALEQASASARMEWLRQWVNAPWLHEVYILLAQLGVDLREFIAEQLQEAEQSFSQPLERKPEAAARAEDETEEARAKAELHAAAWQLAQQAQEMRLILVGRMIEAAGFPSDSREVQRTSVLLAQLFRSTQGLPLPELRRIRVLRAIRGPLADEPVSGAVLREALDSSVPWEQEEAYLALAPLAQTRPEIRERAITRIRQQSIGDDFLLRYRNLKTIAMADPRLKFLRAPIEAALSRHLRLWLVILVLWGCGWWLAFGTRWLLVGMGLTLTHLGFELSRRRSVQKRHPLHEVHLGTLGLGASFVVAMLASVAFSEWFARQASNWGREVLVLPSDCESVFQWGGLIMVFVLALTSLFSTAAKLASFQNLCRLGVSMGLAFRVWILLVYTPSLEALWFGVGAGLVVALSLFLYTLESEAGGTPAFSILLLMVGLGAGYWTLAFSIMIPAVERWSAVYLAGVSAAHIAAAQLIALLLGGTLLGKAFSYASQKQNQLAVAHVIAALILPFVLKLLGKLANFVTTMVPAIGVTFAYAIVGLLILASLFGLALFLSNLFLLARTNHRAALLSRKAPQDPLTLAELPDALRALTQGFIWPGVRKAATEKLGGLQPASEVLALALAHHAASEGCRVDRALLTRAISSLQEQLQREPTLELSRRIERELPVLAALQTELQKQLFRDLCCQWAVSAGFAPEALKRFTEEGAFVGTAREVAESLAERQGKAVHEQ